MGVSPYLFDACNPIQLRPVVRATSTSSRSLLRFSAIACGLLLSWTFLPAQVAVTWVTYNSLVNTTNRTADNITYRNETYAVNSIGTSSEVYSFTGSGASSVFLRRNTSVGNPNNTTTFYEYSSYGSNSTVYGAGDTSPTAGEVMLSSDLRQGLRNPFANSGGTTSLNSNIERIDFYFAGGLTVQEGAALVFFDLENQGNYGDGFVIAAYDTIGTVNGFANAPTNYVTTGLEVAPDSFGNPVNAPASDNPRYLRSTTTSGDNLAANQTFATIDTNSGTPGASDLYLVGILIPLADLGLSVGQTIYGYSLFAGDVSFTSTSQMNNWNNASYYPTNTPSDTWGNMDFMGFGAQVARPVPEPSTYGALLLAAGLAAFGVRRWRFAARRAA